ncbi:hypothetical protein BH10BDE1_BH10BDE1_06800 [soil metagenome]
MAHGIRDVGPSLSSTPSRRLKVMRLYLLMAFCALAFSNSAFAYPTWSSYRTASDEKRALLDQAMVSLVAKIPAEGFKTKRIRFCVRDHLIWETSANASCLSTRAVGPSYGWPPALTNEGFDAAWTAHARFASAFCAAKTENGECRAFDLEPKKSPPEKPGASNFGEPHVGYFMFLAMNFLGATEARAAEVCKVENDQLTTKSGATIFLEFGVQPGQVHAAALTQLAQQAAVDGLPDAVLKDGVDSIMKIGKVLITNARATQPWVQDRVKRDHVIWIGTEFTESELGDKTGKRLSASFDELKAQLIARKITKPFARDAMTTGACPTAAACAWLQDASLRKTVSLVPLASDELKTATVKLQQEETKLLETLQELVTENKISKDEETAIAREYQNLFTAADPPDAKARNRARLRYSVPAVSKTMVSLYDLAVALKKNSMERDQAVVSAVLTQTGNGILSMGTRTRDWIVPMLEASCAGPAASPATAKGAATTGSNRRRGPRPSAPPPSKPAPAASTVN